MNKNSVYTKNCQFRIVAGRLGSIASMMALGSTLATTIDGDIPGAGAISSNGSVNLCQHYFADKEWITEWYNKRGLNEYGYPKNEEINEEIELNYEDLNGEEEIKISRTKTEIEFAGIKGEVDTTKSQKFEEI